MREGARDARKRERDRKTEDAGPTTRGEGKKRPGEEKEIEFSGGEVGNELSSSVFPRFEPRHSRSVCGSRKGYAPLRVCASVRSRDAHSTTRTRRYAMASSLSFPLSRSGEQERDGKRMKVWRRGEAGRER